MTETHATIQCPECGHDFDISDVLYQQVERDLKSRFETELKNERKRYRKELEVSITERLQDEQAERLAALRDELEQKSKQVRKLHKAEADIERLKREKEEVAAKAEADAERKLSELLASEREKIRQGEEEKSSMKLKEKDHLIRQLNERLKDMQRKAEQGSSQVQGEVQELAIEEWLAATYPLDTIEEIKKGQRGADCLQVINTRSATNCGRIYYESKRTKAFQAPWVDKLKSDMREKGANIGVIVTAAMPADMPEMGQKDGVWICTFSDLGSLSNVLRDSLITIHRVVAQQENRGDKTSLVYDFVTSDEFRLQVEAIVEGFSQMQSDLETEKRAMARIWKQREKQIEKVLLNTSNMYGAIRGIAGNAIPSVRRLELPGESEAEPEGLE